MKKIVLIALMALCSASFGYDTCNEDCINKCEGREDNCHFECYKGCPEKGKY